MHRVEFFFHFVKILSTTRDVMFFCHSAFDLLYSQACPLILFLSCLNRSHADIQGLALAVFYLRLYK